jgi:hypothetical protein
MMPTPDRYVVIVYLWDHWGVTYTTNYRNEADRVADSATEKVTCVLVDTQPDREDVFSS